MSLASETYTLGDERDRLDARLDDLADTIADADDPAAMQQVGAQVETRLSGVAYLIDAHGADATVTVEGLTAGAYARVEDKLAAIRAQADGDSLPGTQTTVFAAAGLIEAPFLEGEDPALDPAMAAIREQPIGVAKWLEARVNDLTTVEGNGYEPLSARIAARSEE